MTSEHPIVVVVDDDPTTVRSLGRLIGRWGYAVHGFTEPQEALAALPGLEPLAVVADLYMPDLNGAELLALARRCSPGTHRILLTAEPMVTTLALAMPTISADTIIPKPEMEALLGPTLERARRAGHQAGRHGEHLAHGQVLVKTLHGRGVTSSTRLQRLASRARQLGARMGLAEAQLAALEIGTLLHDVGLLALPDSVLFARAPLDAEQLVQWRRHPQMGLALLRESPFPLGALQVVGSHHEHWDGSGFPEGLTGESIPLLARIFAVVAGYDAWESEHGSSPASDFASACRALATQGARIYDPAIIEALASLPADPWLNAA